MYHLELAKNLPVGVSQPTVMECQWVAVNSRAWVATAYCHLAEKKDEMNFKKGAEKSEYQLLLFTLSLRLRASKIATRSRKATQMTLLFTQMSATSLLNLMLFTWKGRGGLT